MRAGGDGALTTAFGDAILLLSLDPPEAWMVKQSGFRAARSSNRTSRTMYTVKTCVLPAAHPEGEPVPMQVGADFVGVFNNTPAVQASGSLTCQALKGGSVGSQRL
jgi:hypothetical protein